MRKNMDYDKMYIKSCYSSLLYR